MPASLLVIARGVQIAASLLLAGILTFELAVLRPASSLGSAGARVERRLLRLALGSLVAAFLSALLWFSLEVTNMSGLPFAQAFAGPSWRTVLFATRFGHVWQARLILIVACFLLVARRLTIDRSRSGLRFALWFLATALLVSLAWISHAAAAAVQPLGLFGDALHLAAVGAWMGGIPCLAIYLTTTRGAESAPLLQRFSTLSLCCVSVLVVSGLSNAWLLVGSVSALFTTRYGALLLFKLALFAILLGLGARNRFLVKKNLLTPGADPELIISLRRNLRYEIALGLGVVAIVGWLGVTPPPRPACVSASAPTSPTSHSA